nr:hypothetical protein [Tanacetum cinerariifolium]
VGSGAVEMARRWWCERDVEGGDNGSNDDDDVDGDGEGGWRSSGVGWWWLKVGRRVGSGAVEMARIWWCERDVEVGDNGSNDDDDVDGDGEGGWRSSGVGWWWLKVGRRSPESGQNKSRCVWRLC